MPAARTLKYNVFPKKRLFTDMLQTTLKLGVLNWCYRNCDIFLFIFKTWTLKNMDPGKHGVNMGLNLKICLNLVSCFIKTMRTMICCLTVYRYIIKMQQQQQNKKEKKNKAKRKKICSSNIACQQYWSSEQIGLELKVWMSTFLNIRTSRPEVSCKKGVLKMIILQNSLKNNLYAVFNLIKFQAKVFQLYWEETPAYALFVEHRQKYLLKIEIAAPDKFTEAAVCGYFSK